MATKKKAKGRTKPKKAPVSKRASRSKSHLSVVALRLEPGTILRVGDMIHIRGHTTDFSQRVEPLVMRRPLKWGRTTISG